MTRSLVVPKAKETRMQDPNIQPISDGRHPQTHVPLVPAALTPHLVFKTHTRAEVHVA